MTMLVGVVDSGSGELRIANAGQPFALCRSRRSGRTSFLRVSGPPLGRGDGVQYEAASYRLQPGDHLILCSDGVLDARNSAGEAYGPQRLELQVSRHGNPSAALLVAALIDDVRQHRAVAEDDITILALRAST
ncbi:MAG: serine/threonine-protein phosphatase [Candidatus Schekmanbacteria bacterium]|nr:serine/threonine-protein phosphatase [Candidatus Schekmanbacteria bacterium]